MLMVRSVVVVAVVDVAGRGVLAEDSGGPAEPSPRYSHTQHSHH